LKENQSSDCALLSIFSDLVRASKRVLKSSTDMMAGSVALSLGEKEGKQLEWASFSVLGL
jgi:hypothetical protein